MVDMAAITEFATSIRAAMEITKAMKDIHDANVMQTKTFELTREIMAAQSYAMEAAAAQTALLARVRELEEEISKLETWSTEKARYQLREVNTGVFAYVPKQGMEQGEPFHMLCANCYERGEKSILQATQELRMRRRVHVCPRCKTELEMAYVPPSPPGRVESDYNIFTGKPE
jgi:hypothetical protein